MYGPYILPYHFLPFLLSCPSPAPVCSLSLPHLFSFFLSPLASSAAPFSPLFSRLRFSPILSYPLLQALSSPSSCQVSSSLLLHNPLLSSSLISPFIAAALLRTLPPPSLFPALSFIHLHSLSSPHLALRSLPFVLRHQPQSLPGTSPEV